eukprot:538078-Hanusia_phi.AAC.1
MAGAGWGSEDEGARGGELHVSSRRRLEIRGEDEQGRRGDETSGARSHRVQRRALPVLPAATRAGSLHQLQEPQGRDPRHRQPCRGAP